MSDSIGKASVPARSGYGSGIYRRRIVLAREADGVRGELADDFHHFGVTVVCRDGIVEKVAGEDVRVPWTTCPGAVAPLRRLEGARATREIRALLSHTPAREQCTHLHDLACLAIAHTARGEPRRQYDVALPDRVKGATEATLSRDGVLVLSFSLEGGRIVDSSEAAFAGQPLAGRDFHERVSRLVDLDLAEAAWLLQRAVFVGTGRRHDFDQMDTATVFAPVVGAACHSFAPERVEAALRIHGTVRDFTRRPEAIFSGE